MKMFILIFLVSVVAQATTKFETLKTWFNQGRETSYQEIKGFYSGRCFKHSNPDYAENGLLAYLEIIRNQSGPGFPSQVDKRMSLYSTNPYYNDPADYFDNLADVREMGENGIRNEWSRLLLQESPLRTLGLDSNGQLSVTAKYHVYNQYIVTELEVEATRKVMQRCYFFKKVAD